MLLSSNLSRDFPQGFLQELLLRFLQKIYRGFTQRILWRDFFTKSLRMLFVISAGNTQTNQPIFRPGISPEFSHRFPYNDYLFGFRGGSSYIPPGFILDIHTKMSYRIASGISFVISSRILRIQNL